MRTPFLLSVFFFIGFCALTQPTIQSSDYYPSIGESYTVYNAYYISPGPTGNNVTWDLSGLSSYSSHTNNILGPDSSYPSSTHSLKEVGGSKMFLDLSSNEYLLVGISYDWGHLVFNNKNKLFQFPMTMGTTYTDSFSGKIYQNGDTITRTGSAEIEVDGYGTLITPVATYTDVLRVHNYRTIIDNNNGAIDTIFDDMYVWIKAGIHHELANVQLTDWDGAEMNFSFYTEGSNSDLKEEDFNKSLMLFPNPAEDIVTVKTDFKIDQIEIFDLRGQSVIAEYNSINNTIDISGLKSGNYFVHVFSNNKESIKKLTKR